MPRKKKRGGASPRFTVEQVISALEAAGGIRTAAAKVLACSPTTVTTWINKHAKIRKALVDILERRLDIAESVLLRRMSDAAHPSPQITATIFYLKTKGQTRGYANEPPRVALKLPRLDTIDDVLDANRRIIEQAAAGHISLAVAQAFAGLLDTRLKALTHHEVDQRLQAIERQASQHSARH